MLQVDISELSLKDKEMLRSLGDENILKALLPPEKSKLDPLTRAEGYIVNGSIYSGVDEYCMHSIHKEYQRAFNRLSALVGYCKGLEQASLMKDKLIETLMEDRL